MLAHQSEATEETGKAIAERLQNATDNRSGMGLLFVMTGQHGPRFRLVVSRFPANAAIMAEVSEDKLDVAYLEQVFIKRMSAYKAILLEDPNPQSNFWRGMATDRQAGGSPENISNYWIDDFLDADFSDTPQAGTRRLAEALRDAVRINPVMSVKSEIAAAASLAATALAGKSTSVEAFCAHFGLSDDASSTIKAQLSKPGLASKTFVFDAKEFRVKIPFRTVEMESGAILTAPSEKFNKVFEMQEGPDGIVEYRTRGRVADQRMKGR